MLHEDLGTQMQIYLALCDAYKVEIAENVESAMYLLRKTKPEILLLDYKLDQFTSHGKTGVDFIRKVKKKYIDLKVMMIMDNNDQFQIQEHGVDEVLYKPIKNRNLISNVRRLASATASEASLIPTTT